MSVVGSSVVTLENDEREEEREEDEDEDEADERDEQTTSDTTDYAALFSGSYGAASEQLKSSGEFAQLLHFVGTFGHVVKLGDGPKASCADALDAADLEAAFLTPRDELQERLLRALMRLADKRARPGEWQQRVRRFVRLEVAHGKGSYAVFGAALATETELFVSKAKFAFLDASLAFKLKVLPLLLGRACAHDTIVNAADALKLDELRLRPLVHGARVHFYTFDRADQTPTARLFREDIAVDAQGHRSTASWTTLCTTAQEMRDLVAALELSTDDDEKRLLKVIKEHLLAPTEAVEKEALAKERARQRKQQKLDRMGHALAQVVERSSRRARPPPGAFAYGEKTFDGRRTRSNAGDGDWVGTAASLERSTSTMSRAERAQRREQQVALQKVARTRGDGDRPKRSRRSDDSASYGDADENGDNDDDDDDDDDDNDASNEGGAVSASVEIDVEKLAAQEHLARPVQARFEPVAAVAFSPGGHAVHDESNDDDDDDDDDAFKIAVAARAKQQELSKSAF